MVANIGSSNTSESQFPLARFGPTRLDYVTADPFRSHHVSPTKNVDADQRRPSTTEHTEDDAMDDAHIFHHNQHEFL